jgi:hypothetical protein
MTTITQQLADVLRAVSVALECAGDMPTMRAAVASGVAEALAAYDAQQAQPVADGAWVAEPITNVVSAPPLPRRAYREPVASCNSAEYAERIAACVNACAGMTTAEVLEFGAPGELGRCAQAWVAEDNDHA